MSYTPPEPVRSTGPLDGGMGETRRYIQADLDRDEHYQPPQDWAAGRVGASELVTSERIRQAYETVRELSLPQNGGHTVVLFPHKSGKPNAYELSQEVFVTADEQGGMTVEFFRGGPKPNRYNPRGSGTGTPYSVESRRDDVSYRLVLGKEDTAVFRFAGPVLGDDGSVTLGALRDPVPVTDYPGLFTDVVNALRGDGVRPIDSTKETVLERYIRVPSKDPAFRRNLVYRVYSNRSLSSIGAAVTERVTWW